MHPALTLCHKMEKEIPSTHLLSLWRGGLGPHIYHSNLEFLHWLALNLPTLRLCRVRHMQVSLDHRKKNQWFYMGAHELSGILSPEKSIVKGLL